MIVEKEQILLLIKSYLPQAPEEMIRGLTDDIVRDTEAFAFALVRQTSLQERRKMYLANLKTG